MKLIRAMAVLALVSSFAAGQEAPAVDVTRLLRELNDDDVEKRDEATLRLLELGGAAEAALRAAEAEAPAEARVRIRVVLLALEWELPSPIRRAAGRKLAEYLQFKIEDRIALLNDLKKDLEKFPLCYAHVMAVAWEREADDPNSRKAIAELFRDVPGSVHIVARRILARSPGAAGLAALRDAIKTFDDGGQGNLEAPLAVCAAMRDAGLGDLATPGFGALLLKPGDAAQGLCDGAAALEKSGHSKEAILMYRRGVALDTSREEELKRLDALCARENWGSAHLALLKWLPAGTETGIQRARLEKAGALPPMDLSDSLRLRNWTAVPDEEYRLLGDGVLYLAGGYRGQNDVPNVCAYDLKSGSLLWVYASPSEPASNVAMYRGRGSCLFAMKDGLLALMSVQSNLGSGGRLGRSALHTRVVCLAAEGSARWSREYDPNPGMRFELLGDDVGWFTPGGNQSRGRAWLTRLGDGQVVQSIPLHDDVVLAGPGRLMFKKSWSTQLCKVGAEGIEKIWDRKFLPEITTTAGLPVYSLDGDTLFATTGCHAARVDMKSAATEWTHEFDADERTVGAAVRGEDVFVVLEAGGGTWKVVTLDAAKGEPKADFEGPAGPSPRREYGFAEQVVWVSKDAFALAGRIVDTAARRVFSADLEPDAGLPSPKGEQGISCSSGAAPVPYFDFGGVFATLQTGVAPVSTATLREQADVCEKAGSTSAAEALRRTAFDLDPLR
ncbi:MAG: hypothetical protein AAB074_16070 [Planctomycetota bacterium]